MAKKYKAEISSSDLDNYINSINKESYRAYHESIVNELQGKWNEGFNGAFLDRFKEMYGAGSMYSGYTISDRIKQELSALIEYTEKHGLLWDVLAMGGELAYISFSGSRYVWPLEYLRLIEQPDYDNVTMAEMKGLTSSMVDPAGNSLAEYGSMTIESLNADSDNIRSQEERLKKDMEDIQREKTEELQAMRAEIDNLENALREKKKSLEAEISAKMEKMQEELDKLGKQMYLMESRIYQIRSYSGETAEFRRIRDGKPAPSDTPLSVNQKILYLDEDLARLVSIYQDEISSSYKTFDEAVSGSYEVFEAFCPQERALTFFRLSRKAVQRTWDGKYKSWQMEKLLHGNKMGFLLRDGERAYIGWLDESWGYDMEGGETKERAVTFADNFVYRPGEKTTQAADEAEKLHSDDKNTMMSRLFGMSVVQGVLDNRGLIEFPEPVSLARPGKYIAYNFAEGWITDDRFGDFGTLTENLNLRSREDDEILIIIDRSSNPFRGDRDRAHDTRMESGLNRINLVERDKWGRPEQVYVSLKKEYSSSGARANVPVKPTEYINLAYMNSVWLKYYVQTKKLGRYKVSYAELIQHFKRAIERLEAREAGEMELISRYYPEAAEIPEWQLKLSHWKLKNNIRKVTDFQAKRVAEYLRKGEFYEMKNLFNIPEPPQNPARSKVSIEQDGKKLDLGFRWAVSLPQKHFRISGFWEIANIPAYNFAENSYYGRDKFWIDEYSETLDNWHMPKEEREKKLTEILKEKLPGLEARVSERAAADRRKLQEMINVLQDYADEHSVNIRKAMDTAFKGHPAAGYITLSNNGQICLARYSDTGKALMERLRDQATNKYEPYILDSQLQELVYDDTIQGWLEDLGHEIEKERFENFQAEIQEGGSNPNGNE